MIRAGRLRNTVEVQQRTSVRDASGGESVTWLTLTTISAGIVPLSGRERLLADQVQGDVSHRITIRNYADGLTPKYRFKFGSRIFNISSIINVNERNRKMECLCNEEV